MRNRRRILLLVVLGVLASASAAYAFTQLTGLSGSGGGTFSSNIVTNPVLSLTQTGPADGLDAGAQILLPVKLQNVASATEALTAGATVTFTTTPTNCSQYLHWNGDANFSGADPLANGSQLAAGASSTFNMKIGLDANAPTTCASGTWSAAVAAPTNP